MWYEGIAYEITGIDVDKRVLNSSIPSIHTQQPLIGKDTRVQLRSISYEGPFALGGPRGDQVISFTFWIGSYWNWGAAIALHATGFDDLGEIPVQCAL